MKLLLVLLVCFQFAQAQQLAYNNCEGAVFAPVDGSFKLSYLGKKANNNIWVVFVAPQNGQLSIALSQVGASLSFSKISVVKSNDGVCGSKTQQAQIETVALHGDEKLNIQLEKNQHLGLCLTGASGVKDLILFNCVFSPLNPNDNEHHLDLRYDTELPAYTLLIRDLETKGPVAGKVFIQGSSEVAGSYFASKLELNLKQPIKKGTIKIDAPGYFPVEFSARPIPMNKQRTDTLYLQKFELGKISKLEQVYFAAGLPEILEESYPQLNRLRDLLILNPGISIEIHGHVNLDENSAKKAQKLSKQRALMVKKYLVENGIEPERLYPIGFGSTKPVYAKPQDENQKEANRRVEILIKKS